MSRNNDLFFSVLESLKKDIIDNKYPFQSKLPSETELAKKLKISRTTLRKVLTVLREDGFIESRKGDGSYVCNKNITRFVPIIISDNNSDFRKTEIIKGIQDYLDGVGFTSLPTFINYDPKNEIESVLRMIKSGYKNIIIYPTTSSANITFYQELFASGTNFVFVDTMPNELNCDFVTSCNYLGGYIATKKLIELGHKNIAFCSLSKLKDSGTVAERYSGYLAALKHNKLTPSDDLVFIKGNMNKDEFGDYILKNLSSTAVFASTDELGIILSNKFSLLNKSPALIGFDNSLIAENINLASIDQDFYQMGKIAAELVYKRILNPTKNYEHIYTPVKLIERASLTKYKSEA